MATAEDKLASIEREIRYRRRVYPRFVANGQMSQQMADTQLRLMQEIAEDYRKLAEKERLL